MLYHCPHSRQRIHSPLNHFQIRLTPMLTDEPKIPTAHQVQTPQVLIRSSNMLYDLQTTNLADIYPSPDMANVDIPEEPECDPGPVMEAPTNYPPSLNCYDGHHATNKETYMKVSLPAAPSQTNESLSQVSCLRICDIAHQHQHLNYSGTGQT